MAERKFPTMAPQDGLRQLISAHLVPHYDMVQVEMSKSGETEVPLSGVYKKLYDPRSYTGVYAERFRSGDGRINGESDSRPGKDDGAAKPPAGSKPAAAAASSSGSVPLPGGSDAVAGAGKPPGGVSYPKV